MPYSLDPKENKDNPNSPSVYLSMTEQLLYKIAALDASVQSGFRRIDEKMDRFQSDLHQSQVDTNDRINRLDKEMTEGFIRKRSRFDEVEKNIREERESNEKRFTEIETWQKVLTARMSLAGAAVLFAWTFIAPAIRSVFGLGE